MWAFATAGHVSPVPFAAVEEVATGGSKDFNPHGLADTVWAIDATGHASTVLIGDITEVAR